MLPANQPQKSAPNQRVAVISSVIALVVYFAVTSFQGLEAYFTQDDGGNLLKMHKYWEHSLFSVLGSALCVVSRAYRPLGGIYYFTLYKLAGFNPVPFRAVCLILMLVNILLAFALMRRLSGSLAAATLGAVMLTNHPADLELLYSSGTIYEILCFLFDFLAIWFYFVWRQRRHEAGATTLSWRHMAVILALTGCALDSKEMAMTLPASLLLIELTYFPSPPRGGAWRWRTIARYAMHQGRGALLTAALIVPTIAVKVLTHNPLTDDPAYAEHSVRATVEAMRSYQHFLFYGLISPDGFSTLQLALVWAVMAVLAFALRSPSMKFGLGFLVLSMLPICLIARRAGYELYIPLFGWALYAGCLIQRLCEMLIQLLGLVRFRGAVRIGAFAVIAGFIANTHASILAISSPPLRSTQSDMRRLIDRLREIHPQLRRGSRLLLLDDPAQSGFELLFLARLAYADPTLEVDRIKMMPAPPNKSELSRYDLVLAGGWNLHDVHGIPGPQ